MLTPFGNTIKEARKFCGLSELPLPWDIFNRRARAYAKHVFGKEDMSTRAWDLPLSDIIKV